MELDNSYYYIYTIIAIYLHYIIQHVLLVIVMLLHYHIVLLYNELTIKWKIDIQIWSDVFNKSIDYYYIMMNYCFNVLSCVWNATAHACTAWSISCVLWCTHTTSINQSIIILYQLIQIVQSLMSHIHTSTLYDIVRCVIARYNPIISIDV